MNMTPLINAQGSIICGAGVNLKRLNVDTTNGLEKQRR